MLGLYKKVPTSIPDPHLAIIPDLNGPVPATGETENREGHHQREIRFPRFPANPDRRTAAEIFPRTEISETELHRSGNF